MPIFVQDERIVVYSYCEYAQVYYLEHESEQGTEVIQAMTLSRLKQLFRECVLENISNDIAVLQGATELC